jgi:hypothetical protein
MADVNIVIGAQDMASGVMKNIAAQTKIMRLSVEKMADGVVTATRSMTAAFSGLYTTLGPLLAVVLSMQAAFAIFRFGAASIQEFIAAGTPAGVELKESLDLANVALRNMMVVIGSVLAPAVQVAAEIFMVLVQVIAQSLSPAVGGMQAIFESLAPYIEAFKVGIVVAVTTAEVAFKNLGPIVQFALSALQLKFLGMAEDAKHTFTVVIPSYIKWFGENAYNLVRDAAVGMATVLTNFGKNLGEFGAAIYMWVSGGMKGGLDGLMNQLGQTMMVGLADGFEAQTQALPEIAARQMTQYEMELASQMSEIGGNLGEQFNEKFQARVASMTTDLALPDIAEPKAEETAKKLTGGLTAVADSQAAIAQQLSATESRLLTRGPSEGPMQSVAQASQKTAEAAEKTSQSSDRMVELLEQLLARNFIVAEAV